MKSTSKQFKLMGRRITWLFLLCLFLPACYNNFKEKPVVPAPLAKKWQVGQFPINKFWEMEATYPTQAAPSGMALALKPNGECEFYQVTQSNSYGSLTEALVYKKGTVRFHPNQTFTFYPTKGHKREYIKVCDTSYKNYDQNATAQDLVPQTFAYALKLNSMGQDQLIIKGDKPTIGAINLHAANW